jgi:hypothetical protein
LHHDDAAHAEAVGAHVGHILRDVDVHPADHRHHGDQGSGSQNDSEQREKAAKFAAAQRCDGRYYRFPE